MQWYYLVRDGKIINEVRAENVGKASYSFRHCHAEAGRAQVGDQIMVCALKAEPLGHWEWKAP